MSNTGGFIAGIWFCIDMECMTELGVNMAMQK